MTLLERDGLGGDDPAEAGTTLASPLDLLAVVPEVAVGWQVWTVRDGRLRSAEVPGGSGAWQARRALVAACTVARHVAPAPGCSCGVPHRAEDVVAALGARWSEEPVVVGCVALWGGFAKGSTAGPGRRAKRAYPVLLIGNDRVPLAVRRDLAAAYGVPVYASSADLPASFGDRADRVMWRTLRLRLEALLTAGVGGPSPDRDVRELVDTAVATWSAAARWRAEHGRAPARTLPRVAGTAPRGDGAAAAVTPAAVTAGASSGTVPDVAGLVVAWRSWNLAGTSLSSVTRSDRWPGRAPMVGTCPGGSAHRVPERFCTCGVYAAREIDYAAQYHALGTSSSVMGCVGLWGRLVEATFGWRAERAYPLVLFVGPGVAPSTRSALETTYGVPVHQVGAGVRSWSSPTTTRSAATLRAALERSHGRLDDDDVTRAVTALLAVSPPPARSVGVQGGGRPPRPVASRTPDPATVPAPGPWPVPGSPPRGRSHDGTWVPVALFVLALVLLLVALATRSFG